MKLRADKGQVCTDRDRIKYFQFYASNDNLHAMLIFDVKVMPQSGRQAWVLEPSGRLKCFLRSVPENNKANLELLKLLAKQLKLAANQVEIMSGATSRLKKIRIQAELNFTDLLQILGLASQTTIFPTNLRR